MLVGWCVVAPRLQGAASATLPGWVHFATPANFAKHPPQPDSAAELNRTPAGSQRTGAITLSLDSCLSKSPNKLPLEVGASHNDDIIHLREAM